MKAYTDIPQSKRLAEFLPIESADMRYSPLGDNLHPWIWTDTFIEKDAVPCWSLSALMAQMPWLNLDTSKDNHYRVFWRYMYSEWHTNAVDACVELIERVRKEEEQ